MTAVTDMAAPARPPLGVGQIVADVLGVFFTRLPKVLLLSLPAGLGVAAVFYAAISLEDYWVGIGMHGSALAAVLTMIALISIALGTGLGLAASPLAAAFHEYKSRGRVPVVPALGRLRDRPLAAILCGIGVTAATLLPMMMLAAASSARVGMILGMLSIAVGMYAMGRWGMGLPAISRDGLGLSALQRSEKLGEGYRWQIAGTCFLIWFISFLLGGMISAGLAIGVAAVAEFVLGTGLRGAIEDTLIFVDAVIGISTATALIALGLAALRARMVEIKEPPDIADMVDVFD